ncbi:MAG: toprim domain-containing protein [Pseudomonadota bacterium]|nr:toprim domain-containing protein [Pseudomonadota bacterium]
MIAAQMKEVAQKLLGDPNPRHSTRAEWRYGSKGSLAVAIEVGTWFDHEAGVGGGVIDLVRRELQCDLPAALSWLDLPEIDRPHGAPRYAERQTSPRADDADRTRRALALWNEAVSAEATVAERYLASRGVSLPAEPSRVIRYHASCPFGEGRRLPCMLALMRDPATGEPIGVHRTALTPEARKIDRKMLGRAGAIMLSRSDDVTHGLGIAEGIETALSVLAAGWAPVWAIGSAGGIAGFPVLGGIECLTVFADADDAGQNAARAVAERYAGAGREAFVQTPPAGDFNDRLQGVAYA